jgi:phage shock protein A
MSSPAINTVIKMMESLPENTQEKIAVHLRRYIQDLQEEQKWSTFLNNPQNKLLDAEKLAKKQLGELETNPEKVLEKIFINIFTDILADLEAILIEFRRTVAKELARLKRIEHAYNKYQSEVHMWKQREQLAINKGNENFAHHSREWIKLFTYKISAFKMPREKQTNHIENLKMYLLTLETKISKLQTQKDVFLKRVTNAQNGKQLQKTIGILNIKSTKEALVLMNEVLLELEKVKDNVNSNSEL